MEYVHVRNWSKFQHYFAKRPAWIKLYVVLLRDPEFNNLPEETQLHLVKIWMLAADMENKIPADPKWLQSEIKSKRPPDVTLLVRLGYLELNDSQQATMNNPEESCIILKDPEKSCDHPSVSVSESSSLRTGRMQKPTEAEVATHIREKGYHFTAAEFIASNDAKGWVVGKNRTPMVDWKAACRTWELYRRKESGEIEHRPRVSKAEVEAILAKGTQGPPDTKEAQGEKVFGAVLRKFPS